MIFYKTYNYKSFDPSKFLDFLPDVCCQTDMTTYVCTRTDHDKIRQALNVDYRIYSALYFCVGPKINNHIHIDSKLNAKYFPKIALNIPLENCHDTRMFWYQSLDIEKESFMLGPSRGDKIPYLPFDNAKLLKEVCITKPTFIRIDKWHNIENFNNEVCAKILSIRFFNSKYFQY